MGFFDWINNLFETQPTNLLVDLKRELVGLNKSLSKLNYPLPKTIASDFFIKIMQGLPTEQKIEEIEKYLSATSKLFYNSKDKSDIKLLDLLSKLKDDLKSLSDFIDSIKILQKIMSQHNTSFLTDDLLKLSDVQEHYDDFKKRYVNDLPVIKLRLLKILEKNTDESIDDFIKIYSQREKKKN